MEEYNRLVERQRKWMLYLLVFFLIAIFITPYERLFMSILLGYVVGFYSLRFLQTRIKGFAETVFTEGRARSLGTFIRIAAIGIIVLLAARFPEKIHIPWLALGLGLSYIILFTDFTIQQVIADRKSNE
ncbi:MAG TPA: ATP synthase subunit I [Bacillota bacterium]|nr:ATP synthase subunit I [Bacillota bacterium]